MGVSQDQGFLFGPPHKKGYSILRFLLESPMKPPFVDVT